MALIFCFSLLACLSECKKKIMHGPATAGSESTAAGKRSMTGGESIAAGEQSPAGSQSTLAGDKTLWLNHLQFNLAGGGEKLEISLQLIKFVGQIPVVKYQSY